MDPKSRRSVSPQAMGLALSPTALSLAALCRSQKAAGKVSARAYAAVPSQARPAVSLLAAPAPA